MHQHCTGSFWNVELPRFLCVSEPATIHNPIIVANHWVQASQTKSSRHTKNAASHQQPQAPKSKKKGSSPAAGILKPSSIFFSLAASAGAEESWCTDVHSVEPVETAKNDKTWRLEHG